MHFANATQGLHFAGFSWRIHQNWHWVGFWFAWESWRTSPVPEIIIPPSVHPIYKLHLLTRLLAHSRSTLCPRLSWHSQNKNYDDNFNDREDFISRNVTDEVIKTKFSGPRGPLVPNQVTRVSDMGGGRVDQKQTSSSLLLYSIFLTAVTAMLWVTILQGSLFFVISIYPYW